MGRDAELTELRSRLVESRKAGLVQALAGLGGVGKTQTAVEYAYRHRDDYAFVLWATAEAPTTLIGDYVRIARELGLLEANADDAMIAVAAMKRWLERQPGYLLVLDNADEPEQIRDFIPKNPSGHILITSRKRKLNVLQIPHPIVVETLLPESAVAFLLKRANRADANETEKQAAIDLAGELGYLPLALEQAAAYIDNQDVTFRQYLADYRMLELTHLDKQSPEYGDYPLSVGKTWQKSMDAVRAKSPASADLLTASAFLASEAIPYEIFTGGALELGKLLAASLADEAQRAMVLSELLTELDRYSLITRNLETETFDIHRMVQAVSRATLSEEERHIWIERILKALETVRPGQGAQNWQKCARLTAHWTTSTAFAAGFDSPAESEILITFGTYNRERGLYHEAEKLFLRALEVCERILGPEHLDTAGRLNDLAYVYRAQGKLTKAKPLYERAFKICERNLGLNHPDTATIISNLAVLYQVQGKRTEAEPLYKRALEIRERSLGSDHLDTTTSLNNLASLYQVQGKLIEAEPLFERALEIRERILGSDHPLTTQSLNNLAHFYWTQGKLAEAEPLYVRALEIRNRTLGPDHPDTAIYIKNLANLYQAQGKLTEAKQLYEHALEMCEHNLGPNHPDTAMSINDLALLYRIQGQLLDAEALCRRALKIFDHIFEPQHPDVINVARNLTVILRELDRAQEADEINSLYNLIT